MTKKLKGPAMTTYQCPVTGQVYDGEEILIPTEINPNDSYNDWSSQKPVHMGLKICPEVQEKIDKGFIVLVVIDPDKSEIDYKARLSKDDLSKVYRTGEVIYIKRQVAKDIFNVNIESFMFIDTDCRDRLRYDFMPEDGK